MTPLIFGGNGQLAKSLQLQFSRENIDFFSLSKNDIDISKPDMITYSLKKFSPTIVINLAAYTAVDYAESNIDLAYEVNAIGCQNLAINCSLLKIPLIHLSTDYVFDGASDKPYKPSDSPNPINIYGASKLKGEELIQEHSNEYTILRTSGVYGEFGNNFLKTMLNLIQKSKEIRVISDQLTTPTYSGDLAFAISRICFAYNAGRLENQIYHYGGPKILSWFDFTKEILLHIHDSKPHLNLPVLIPIHSKNYYSAATRPMFSALDSSKLSAKYNLPEVEISDRIKSTINKILVNDLVG